MLAALPEHTDRLDWSFDRIRSERQRRLRRLLRVALDRSPWHRSRLGGIDPETFAESDLRTLPVMTKDDLMEHFDEIVTDPRLKLVHVNRHIETLTSRDAYLLDEYHAAASGGSTGRRGVFVYDWEGWKTYFLLSERWSARAKKRDPGRALSAGSVGAAIVADKASHASVSLYQTFARPAHSFPATDELENVVDGLNEVQPDSLIGYASMLQLLVSEARAGRLNISPRLVVSCCEQLLPETEAGIGQLWGVHVVNNYGTTEGLWGLTCGEAEGLHLPDDFVIVEPVDKSGEPATLRGTAAKLYITRLYNMVQPLIRYELADQLDFIDSACPCGSVYQRVSEVRGRSDDVFVYADGAIVHPIVFRSALGRQARVVEYQVAQTERGALIHVRADGRFDEKALVREIEEGLRRAGLVHPHVVITLTDRIERQVTGKLRRFVPLEHTRAHP